MKLSVGFELVYDCPQPTPMILTLNVHDSRFSDMLKPDALIVSPSAPMKSYRDGFGNWCTRIVAPQGETHLRADSIVRDPGTPDRIEQWAWQHEVHDLPEDTLVFLLGSRYCETDSLSETAWGLFDKAPMGWGRVQAICDFVHRHIQFGYEHARPTRTALEAFRERRGVCRDFAHLAVAFCRCMNIPGCCGVSWRRRRTTSVEPMDFSAGLKSSSAAVGTFDARNNTPRISRVLIARGRDAADLWQSPRHSARAR